MGHHPVPAALGLVHGLRRRLRLAGRGRRGGRAGPGREVTTMLNAEELKEWIAQNGTGEKERRYINGISYLFTVMNDGWIAIFEVDNGLYIPLIQEIGRAHV